MENPISETRLLQPGVDRWEPLFSSLRRWCSLLLFSRPVDVEICYWSASILHPLRYWWSHNCGRITRSLPVLLGSHQRPTIVETWFSRSPLLLSFCWFQFCSLLQHQRLTADSWPQHRNRPVGSSIRRRSFLFAYLAERQHCRRLSWWLRLLFSFSFMLINWLLQSCNTVKSNSHSIVFEKGILIKF